MFRLPKGRRLYHKERKEGVEKESVFTFKNSRKYPGTRNRLKKTPLKIDPFKSYFEIN